MFRRLLRSLAQARLHRPLIQFTGACLMAGRHHCQDSSTPSAPPVAAPSPPIVYRSFGGYEVYHYDKSLIEAKDVVVIIVNPQHYKDELFALLAVEAAKIPQKLRVKFLAITSEEEKEHFESDFRKKIKGQTLLMVRNRYLSNFSQFSLYDFMSKPEILQDCANKLTKLNSKTGKMFSEGIGKMGKEATIILMYNPKGTADYQKNKSLLKKIIIYESLQNSKFIYIMVNQPSLIAELGVNPASSHPGELMLLKRHSSYFTTKPSLEIAGLPFYLQRKIEFLSDKGQVVLAESLNRFSLTPQRRYVTGNKYVVEVRIDKNKISKDAKRKLLEKCRALKQTLAQKQNKDYSIIVRTQNLDGVDHLVVVEDVAALAKSGQLAENTSLSALSQPLAQEVLRVGNVFRYKYTGALDYESFIEFMARIKTADQFHENQGPSFIKGSRKLTAGNFRTVVGQKPTSVVMFVRDKKSESGNSEVWQFQELARNAASIQRIGEKVQFCRISATRNELEGVPSPEQGNFFVMNSHRGLELVSLQQIWKRVVLKG